jgi:glycogen debranching enzyme
MSAVERDAEWLEADGLGGFASGTVSGIRTRRYHALLLTATMPPARRMVLVNGFDAWIETQDQTFALSSQRYCPDIIHPDGSTEMHQHLSKAGLGRISEICDAEPPHTPRGCPFQAWSLGELIRLERSIL